MLNIENLKVALQNAEDREERLELLKGHLYKRFHFEGAYRGEREEGFTCSIDTYTTHNYGELDKFQSGASEVFEDGKKWRKVFSSVFGGDAWVPGDITEYYVEVQN